MYMDYKLTCQKGYLGNLLEEITSTITHECFYDHYAHQIISVVWSRETPSSAENTFICITNLHFKESILLYAYIYLMIYC